MMRPVPGIPSRGWRRLIWRCTGGRVRPAPSLAEIRQRELIARAKVPIQGCRVVAVVSRKGGIGKTTTTLELGHTFATHRGDRVIALDANPDAGSLGYRVKRETPATVTQLLAEAHGLDRYCDVRAFTSQASTRLEVLASDDDPHITEALGEAEYRRVMSTLQRHYNLILVDSGTGVLDSATQGILRMADQLVVCAATGLDAARVAGSTLDWLDEHDYGDLVRQAVVVINQVRDRTGQMDVDQLERHFSERCRAVVRVPWDIHLSDGAETTLDELEPATREAYVQLAAEVAEGFGARSRSELEFAQ
jgi:putative peptide zinc metalloprotease protein